MACDSGPKLSPKWLHNRSLLGKINNWMVFNYRCWIFQTSFGSPEEETTLKPWWEMNEAAVYYAFMYVYAIVFISSFKWNLLMLDAKLSTQTCRVLPNPTAAR